MEKENKVSLLYKVAIARKVNAVISLVCTIMILIHGVYDALWMFMRGKMDRLPKPFAWVLMGVVIVHAILSIVTAILATKGKKNKEEKMYAKPNIKTLLQRMFGMIIIVLLPPHIIGMQNRLKPYFLHSIIHPLFYIVVYTHTAISTSKAFITLGIGNAKFIKIVDKVMYVICAVAFVMSIVGTFTAMYGSWN